MISLGMLISVIIASGFVGFCFGCYALQKALENAHKEDERK